MIASGHPPAAVWGYTPRELGAWLEVIDRIERREKAMALADATLAARGEPDKLKERLEDLTDE